MSGYHATLLRQQAPLVDGFEGALTFQWGRIFFLEHKSTLTVNSYARKMDTTNIPKIFISTALHPAALDRARLAGDVITRHEFEFYLAERGGSGAVSNVVRRHLRESDALLALIGPSSPSLNASDERASSAWIQNEIGMAFQLEIPILAVFESGVKDEGVTPWVTTYEVVPTDLPRSFSETVSKLVGTLRDRYRQKGFVSRRNQIQFGDAITAAREIKRQLGELRGGYMPDLLIGVSGGGLMFAELLSKILGHKPVMALWVDRFSDDGQLPSLQNRYNQSKLAQVVKQAGSRRLLLVDDMVYTGKTLERAAEYLNLILADSRVALKTAAMCNVTHFPYTPDYWGIESRSEHTKSPWANSVVNAVS